MSRYLNHIKLEDINSQNVWTICGRIVSPVRAHATKDSSNCKECLNNTHPTRNFKITRVDAIYKNKLGKIN